MSKIREAFKAIHITNSWNICESGGGKVFLDYHTGGSGRGSMPSKWVVIGIRFQTDPKAHWTDNGCKAFSGRMRSPALDEAKKWASERFGIAEWVRDPFGGWQDAKVLARAKELLGNKMSEPQP